LALSLFSMMDTTTRADGGIDDINRPVLIYWLFCHR
jgi:hypothetical protein